MRSEALDGCTMQMVDILVQGEGVFMPTGKPARKAASKTPAQLSLKRFLGPRRKRLQKAATKT